MQILITIAIALLLGLAATQAPALEPPRGPVETYKGVKLVGTALPKRKSNKFSRNAKLAIDMVQQLPKASWNKTSFIKEIVYYPPRPDRVAPGITSSIVGNAIHAEQHHRIASNIRLIKDMQSGKVAMDAAKLKQARLAVEYGDGLLSKTLPKDVLFRENCTPRIAIIEAR